MNAPTYRWSCHACAASNPAGASRCVACGFPASASGIDIELERKSRQPSLESTAATPPTPPGTSSFVASDLALFFPEGLLAAIALVASPFWAASLVYKGAHLAAGVLMLCVGLGAATGLFAWRSGNKALLYGATLLVLLGGWAASSLR